MTSSSWPVTPMPGSMTTHCSPAPGATTQQFVSVASDGKPAMSTAGTPEPIGDGRVRTAASRSQPTERRRYRRRPAAADIAVASVDCRGFAQPPAPADRTEDRHVATNKQRRDAERRPPAAPARGAPGTRGPPQARHAHRLDRRHPRRHRRRHRRSWSPRAAATTRNRRGRASAAGARPRPRRRPGAAASPRRRRRRRLHRGRGRPARHRVLRRRDRRRGHEPQASQGRSTSTTPTALTYKDLVVGKGAAADADVVGHRPVHRRALQGRQAVRLVVGARAGRAVLAAAVVPGFTQGIGGTGKVAADEGRRPPDHHLTPSLGYGAQAPASIPANSPLVFVVDLVKIG